jgi:hypothetical protein
MRMLPASCRSFSWRRHSVSGRLVPIDMSRCDRMGSPVLPGSGAHRVKEGIILGPPDARQHPRVSACAAQKERPVALPMNDTHPSRRITIAFRSLLVAAVVSLSFLVMHPTPALAYSCGDPHNNHCYSIYQRTGPNGEVMLGTSVAITVTDMSCPYCGYDFIDDEMWLVDNRGYWVEAGYMVDSFDNSGRAFYFWADIRPVDHTFWQHPMGVIPSADYYHNATYWIWRTPGWSNRFSVQMISWATSWTGVSTSNSMLVDKTQMGMELSGYSGAHASNAFFTSRYYQAQNGYWYPLPSWSLADPQESDWPTHINQNGADFYTYCQC